MINLEKFKHKSWLDGRIIAINADCVDVMREIGDKTFNLIISDGPYFKICGSFDWAFKTMQDWINWHILLRDEFERIMADNGSLFVFGDDKNIAYLQVEFDKRFNLLNNIIYRKVNALTIKGIMDFNSFAPITERILFYDKGENKTGLEMIKKIMPNPFAEYLKEEFKRAGITNREIASLFPSASGGLTGCVSNWLNGDNIMTKEQYLKVRNHLNNEYLRKEYEDLRKEYEDLRRPFNNQFRLTDVIDAKLKSSFHPTTKDGAVIEKLILTTTKENDLVFSPFLGSGTDAMACIRTKRRFIGCELDKEYFEKACERIETELKQLTLF
ncbi:MAG: site-specific DNA-methyltransferase [Proteobacteria bacterium]|nr:site-specific DNA-methyltransferase [Pseudomonadota bacterium]